ncbi:hypothetical protein ADUPG1_007025 [Aduncisulcus paluster]|uniref:Uncharacterized protein n=1 Tax=Aduncisulcus paluster TaxID=2918883 RepID=A0ABQ5KNE1_9EUKA|nr:hypothetical protein ADUPG1_007025 [Aduncisulcus paluster]
MPAQEQILKSQEREGITKVADAVHIATTWRNHDGKKHIDDILEASSGADSDCDIYKDQLEYIQTILSNLRSCLLTLGHVASHHNVDRVG